MKQVPKTILSDVSLTCLIPERLSQSRSDPFASRRHQYMIRLMKSPSDLFLMRKQFTLQMASVTFITYVAALQQRTLPRFNISRSTGMIFMSELLRESETDLAAPFPSLALIQYNYPLLSPSPTSL